MNRLVLFILLMLFWVILTWPNEWSANYWQDISIGVIACLLVTWIMGESTSNGETSSIARRWLQPKRYFWALVYVAVLSVYIVKANLELAYRVLHPRMPIQPGIVRIKTKLQTTAARTALCNSITLTPGTLAVDLQNDGTMMVHWIYVRTADAEEAADQILGRFEWFIAKIFE